MISKCHHHSTSAEPHEDTPKNNEITSESHATRYKEHKRTCIRTLADEYLTLSTYISSLKETAELPARVVLTGHGDPVENHLELISERLSLHDRRANKIRSLLIQQPLTAFEIAEKIWGSVVLTQTFLAISEVLGHLGLLLQQEAAQEQQSGSKTIFTAR